MLEEPKTKFIKVRCDKCKNEQIIFSNPSTEVRCLVCNELIARPNGGKTKINATVLEILK